MASCIKGIQELSCGEHYKHKWKFKLKFSSVFHFELVNDGWISDILHVYFNWFNPFLLFLDILQMTGIMSDEPETNTTAPQHQQQSQNTNDIQQRLTTARNTTTLQKGK